MKSGIFPHRGAALAAVTVLSIGMQALSPAAFAQSSTPTATQSVAPHSDAAVEAHIKRLHDQLKITSAEADQWNTVAQIMRDNEHQISGLIQQRAKNAPSMSAVDNLRTYEAITDAHEDGLKKLVPAFETLYGSMSDAQKKTADAVFSQRAQSRTAAQSKPSTAAKSPTG